MKTLLYSIIFFLLLGGIALAEGPSYQPGVTCTATNISSLGTNQQVAAFAGTRVDFRITVEGSGKIRCTFGNIYGSSATTSSANVGYEITSTVPFDAYPYVSPTAEVRCTPETGSPAIDFLACNR